MIKDTLMIPVNVMAFAFEAPRELKKQNLIFCSGMTEEEAERALRPADEASKMMAIVIGMTCAMLSCLWILTLAI